MHELEHTLGYLFKKRGLLEQALTHPSYRNEMSLDGDNQRMEFLGDAALGLAAADYLYKSYPDDPEGRMTMLRSSATSTTTLALLARQLDLGTHILLGKGEDKSGGHSKESNLADALEAIIGAIYLDGGQHAVEQVFVKHFAPLLNENADTNESNNPKGQLQEWAQAKGLPCPVYEVTNTEGPAHNRWFTVEVIINNELKTEGNGTTKRAAEADAATNLLTSFTTEQSSPP